MSTYQTSWLGQWLRYLATVGDCRGYDSPHALYFVGVTAPAHCPPPRFCCLWVATLLSVKVLYSLEKTVTIAEGSVSWGGTIQWAIPERPQWLWHVANKGCNGGGRHLRLGTERFVCVESSKGPKPVVMRGPERVLP